MRRPTLLLLLLLASCPSRIEGGPTGGSGGAGGGSGGTGTGNSGTGNSGTGNSGNSGTGNSGNSGTGNSGNSGTGNSGNSGTGGAGNAGNAGGEGGAVEICPSFDACSDCQSVSCPEVYCQCYENFDCFDLLNCFSGCVDDECQQTCMTTYQNGYADLVLLSDCAATECSVCGWGNEVGECGQCLFQDCDVPLNECIAFPDCWHLWQCLNECPPVNVVCQQGCYDSYPDGAMLLQPVFDCAGMECSVECPGANG